MDSYSAITLQIGIAREKNYEFHILKPHRILYHLLLKADKMIDIDIGF